MSLPLQIWLIEHYSKPGDIILDPMCGSGTILAACSLSRNVIAVELEKKFVEMTEGNWKRVQEVGPELGHSMGWAIIRRGDARQLAGVLADVVIFSPPYSDVIRRGNPGGPGASGKGKPPSCLACYSEDPSNIGNTKGDNYMRSMRIVYRNCWRALKPNGLMILVVKPFIRNQQVIHLERDTQKLCESVGFTFLEEHYRRLTHMSFWLTLYYRKHPKVERVDKEFILVFRKEANAEREGVESGTHSKSRL